MSLLAGSDGFPQSGNVSIGWDESVNKAQVVLGESAREVYEAWQGRRMAATLPAAARGSMGAVALQMAVPARVTRTLSVSLSWFFPNRKLPRYCWHLGCILPKWQQYRCGQGVRGGGGTSRARRKRS